MNISELRQHLGEEVTLICYLQEAKENSNKYQNRWMDLLVSDGSGETALKMWAEQLDATVKDLEGSVIKGIGEVDLFQDRAGMNVATVTKAEEGTYVLSEMLPSISKKEEEDLRNRFMALMSEMKDSPLKLLVSYVLKSRLDKMATSLGGSDHHKYNGGLLRHTVEVAELARFSARQYKLSKEPYASDVNEDLCVAASLLHDVGKLSTIMNGPGGRRTMRGLLVDTEVESTLIVNQCNLKLKSEGVEDISELLHVILMCNHRKDTLKPRKLEAIIVSDANHQSISRDAYSYAFYAEERKTASSSSSVFSKTLGVTLVQ